MILNMNPKKVLLWGLWVTTTSVEPRRAVARGGVEHGETELRAKGRRPCWRCLLSAGHGEPALCLEDGFGGVWILQVKGLRIE